MEGGGSSQRLLPMPGRETGPTANMPTACVYIDSAQNKYCTYVAGRGVLCVQRDHNCDYFLLA